MKVIARGGEPVLVRHWWRLYCWDGFKRLHRVVKKSPEKKK